MMDQGDKDGVFFVASFVAMLLLTWKNGAADNTPEIAVKLAKKTVDLVEQEIDPSKKVPFEMAGYPDRETVIAKRNDLMADPVWVEQFAHGRHLMLRWRTGWQKQRFDPTTRMWCDLEGGNGTT